MQHDPTEETPLSPSATTPDASHLDASQGNLPRVADNATTPDSDACDPSQDEDDVRTPFGARVAAALGRGLRRVGRGLVAAGRALDRVVRPRLQRLARRVSPTLLRWGQALARLLQRFGRLLVRGAERIYAWLAAIPYGRIASLVLRRIGQLMHWLLFHVLLPKKYRTLSKRQFYNIIFKSDTPAGKRFDIWLLVAIGVNLLLLVLDSFPKVHEHLGLVLKILEWGFTLLFTFEYYLRIWCSRRPWKYVLSFYGIIDLLSILPAYLSLVFPSTQTLTVLRVLRTLRVFRVLHMHRFIAEGSVILNTLKRSLYKIVIFMLFIFLTSVVLGAVVYMFEEGHNPAISSIPEGIYWAAVTLTTVGYGDIAPVTAPGRFISMIVMILGYSIIAVPTGIVVGETINARNEKKGKKQPASDAQPASRKAEPPVDTTPASPADAAVSADAQPRPATKYCPHCGFEEADREARYCRLCGTPLKDVNNHSWLNDFFAN